MRQRARTDANHSEIMEALRGIGASVVSLHQVGKGVPDLLVGRRGKNVLLEVKDGSKSPSQRRLTKDERDYKDSWSGQYDVVFDPEHAVRVVMFLTK